MSETADLRELLVVLAEVQRTLSRVLDTLERVNEKLGAVDDGQRRPPRAGEEQR